MQEGWLGEDYLILFDQSEAKDATQRYGITDVLPSCILIGLKSWDDFIVLDANERVFTIPTIPLDTKYLAQYQFPNGRFQLTHDPRFTSKIKWYTKPIIFGGDPNIGDNLIWVTHQQHMELVHWWNKLYRELGNTQ